MFSLDLELPVEKLPLPAGLAGKTNHQELDLAAVNRRGQEMRCHVTCTALATTDDERQGLVLLMEETPT